VWIAVKFYIAATEIKISCKLSSVSHKPEDYNMNDQIIAAFSWILLYYISSRTSVSFTFLYGAVCAVYNGNIVSTRLSAWPLGSLQYLLKQSEWN
jgi:hypothetical protein